MLHFNPLYAPSKPIRWGFCAPSLINATGFYFVFQGNINNRCYSRYHLFCCNANVDTWRPGFPTKKQTNKQKKTPLLNCGIIFKASGSNIGLSRLQISDIFFSFCCNCCVWHTQTPRQQYSKRQSFPVDTCHLIHACLKRFHSINPLFYRVNSVGRNNFHCCLRA